MNEDKIIEFLEEFGTLSEGMTDEERIELMTSMLDKLPEEDQDAILDFCADEDTVNDDECDCCECEEDDEMKELKIIEKEIDVSLAKLAYEDEVDRLERLNDEAYVSGETYDGDLYYEGMEQVEVFASMLKHLLNEGVDYTNSMIVVSNFFTNKQNLEMSKVQSIQASMSQI